MNSISEQISYWKIAILYQIMTAQENDSWGKWNCLDEAGSILTHEIYVTSSFSLPLLHKLSNGLFCSCKSNDSFSQYIDDKQYLPLAKFN